DEGGRAESVEEHRPDASPPRAAQLRDEPRQEVGGHGDDNGVHPGPAHGVKPVEVQLAPVELVERLRPGERHGSAVAEPAPAEQDAREVQQRQPDAVLAVPDRVRLPDPDRSLKPDRVVEGDGPRLPVHEQAVHAVEPPAHDREVDAHESHRDQQLDSPPRGTLWRRLASLLHPLLQTRQRRPASVLTDSAHRLGSDLAPLARLDGLPTVRAGGYHDHGRVSWVAAMELVCRYARLRRAGALPDVTMQAVVTWRHKNPFRGLRGFTSCVVSIYWEQGHNPITPGQSGTPAPLEPCLLVDTSHPCRKELGRETLQPRQ